MDSRSFTFYVEADETGLNVAWDEDSAMVPNFNPGQNEAFCDVLTRIAVDTGELLDEIAYTVILRSQDGTFHAEMRTDVPVCDGLSNELADVFFSWLRFELAVDSVMELPQSLDSLDFNPDILHKSPLDIMAAVTRICLAVLPEEMQEYVKEARLAWMIIVPPFIKPVYAAMGDIELEEVIWQELEARLENSPATPTMKEILLALLVNLAYLRQHKIDLGRGKELRLFADLSVPATLLATEAFDETFFTGSVMGKRLFKCSELMALADVTKLYLDASSCDSDESISFAGHEFPKLFSDRFIGELLR